MKNIAEFLKRELFSVQNIFLVSCLFWGILFLFLNPPFQAPDEDAHFFKMYGYTSGSLNFKKLNIFGHDVRYKYFGTHWDSEKEQYVVRYTDNGIGWWYPGEPESGKHAWPDE